MNKEKLIESITSLMKEIANEAKELIRQSMDINGINEKVGFNTLIDSDIFNNIEASVEDVEIIKLMVNDYIVYIESGRAPGSFPPPNVIAEWCHKKGIPSDNSTVYLICRSIYMNGIKPRPIFEGTNGVWAFVEEYFESWCDMIFNTITEEYDTYFNGN